MSPVDAMVGMTELYGVVMRHLEGPEGRAMSDMAGPAGWAAGQAQLPGEPLLAVQVAGRPPLYSTAATAPWKEAVRAAIEAEGVEPSTGRFAVSIEFRTPLPRNSTEVWDLDNLVKATLDALDGVFGLRPWTGLPQPADDRVDYLVASKRTVTAGEEAGATITVHAASWSRRGRVRPRG